jgi:hypothetical protein
MPPRFHLDREIESGKAADLHRDKKLGRAVDRQRRELRRCAKRLIERVDEPIARSVHAQTAAEIDPDRVGSMSVDHAAQVEAMSSSASSQLTRTSSPPLRITRNPSSIIFFMNEKNIDDSLRRSYPWVRRRKNDRAQPVV